MNKETRLYNMILPIWLLVLFPQIWLIVVPANLIIDCSVLLLTLAALKHTAKKAVLGQVWWKLWLLGFAADFVGVAWMALSLIPSLWWDTPFGRFWESTVGNAAGNTFRSPLSFLWTLIGVALAGLCIYLFDRRALRSCTALTHREQRTVAIVMAVATAPWTFFIPMY